MAVRNATDEGSKTLSERHAGALMDPERIVSLLVLAALVVVPPVAYYILGAAQLLTTSNVFPKVEPLAGPTPAETWQWVTKAVTERLRCIVDRLLRVSFRGRNLRCGRWCRRLGRRGGIRRRNRGWDRSVTPCRLIGLT